MRRLYSRISNIKGKRSLSGRRADIAMAGAEMMTGRARIKSAVKNVTKTATKSVERSARRSETRPLRRNPASRVRSLKAIEIAGRITTRETVIKMSEQRGKMNSEGNAHAA